MNVTRLQPAEIPQIWHCLQQISDPELPVLSITDLGMVRDVVRDGSGWRVTFTPTYSGCPATEFLLNAIEQRLAAAGFSPDHRLDERRRPRAAAAIRRSAPAGPHLRSAACPRPGRLPALRQHPQREDQRVRIHRL